MDATQHVFDITASRYDADRARLIPCYDNFYRWAVDLIPADADHILDLGAGSGLLSAFIRRRLPNARLHLIDSSGPMLAHARDRFAGDPAIEFQLSDYTTADLSGPYDAVVSALSIHHLEHAAKRALFARIFSGLKPGGVFINAEQVLGPTAELEARYKALWLDQVRAAGATPQQVADSLYRQQQDRCATVEDQLAWMREAGFAEADCWFKDNRFAVLSGSHRARG